MVEAADYLVKNRIVHCSMTPDNVIIMSENFDKIEVKICGFGNAKWVEMRGNKKR